MLATAFHQGASEFDRSELGLERQREVDEILAGVPSATEVRKGLSKLKNGKAAGICDFT